MIKFDIKTKSNQILRNEIKKYIYNLKIDSKTKDSRKKPTLEKLKWHLLFLGWPTWISRKWEKKKGRGEEKKNQL